MESIKTDIIPESPTFITTEDPHELDLKAICVFAATGFFLDTDTYFQHRKVLKPASIHSFDASNNLVTSEPWFQWHYNPRKISFDQALDEFQDLFEQIMLEQTKGKSVILPLSGGIDSRTQAVALRNHPQVTSFSYSFKNGYPEDKFAAQIANKSGFKFQSFEVPKVYLWDCIEELASINECYTDFTHPRQMAFIDKYKQLGDIFSLGHWGDVLFDSFILPQLSQSGETDIILKKITQKGGVELASSLWKDWKLEGAFADYFKARIETLLSDIKIDDTNSKLRAFKSSYWAPRWTAVNANIFSEAAPITLPYFDNRMCEFICTVPEAYLKNRQLQIGYIKRSSPELAKIIWHEQKPFNLNNYHLNKSPYNLPYRVINKLSREIKKFIGKPHVSRNWELQFVGKENDKHLKEWLFDSGLDTLVPNDITHQFYNNFRNRDAVKYSHPVSMLLTLALFNKKFNKKSDLEKQI